jgi:hypothetical protein
MSRVLIDSGLLYPLGVIINANDDDVNFLTRALPRLNLDGGVLNQIFIIINACIAQNLLPQLKVILTFINKCKRIHTFGRFFLQKVFNHGRKGSPTSFTILEAILNACVTLSAKWCDQNKDIIEQLLQLCIIDDNIHLFNCVYVNIKSKSFPLYNICIAACNFGSVKIFKHWFAAFNRECNVSLSHCHSTIGDYSQKSIAEMQTLLNTNQQDEWNKKLRNYLWRQSKRSALAAWINFQNKPDPDPLEKIWYSCY